jgi:hypothetical protein
MLIIAILVLASESKLAVDFRMNVEAFVTKLALWEVLTFLARMEVRTLIWR